MPSFLLNILFIVYSIALTVTIRQVLRQKKFFQILPSLGWTIFMVLPYWLTHGTFKSEYLLPQEIGILCVGIALLLADADLIARTSFLGFVQKHFTLRSIRNLPQPEFWHKWGPVLLFVGVVFLPMLHLFLMPEIPLLELIKGSQHNETEWAELRERASKYLAVPRAFIYLCQWSQLILMPLLFLHLMRNKQWLWSTLTLIFALFYARATLAKSPLFFSLVFLLLVYTSQLWRNSSHYIRKLFFVGSTTICAIFIAFALVFFTSHPLSLLHFREPLPEQALLRREPPGENSDHLSFTIGDHFRFLMFDHPEYLEQTSSVQRALQYSFYRGFLVPVEVSHRWYSYFPDMSQGFIGFTDLRKRSLIQNEGSVQISPANLVGKWAYFSRFKVKYLESVQAYASADADAWARGGYWGLAVLTLLIYTLRTLSHRLAKQNSFSRELQISFVLLLSVLLPVASLQAILVAQGLIVVLFLMLLNFVLANNTRHLASTQLNEVKLVKG